MAGILCVSTIHSYGNPLVAYGPDNMPVCYVWAYGGRHPLARIDGLTYSQYTEVKNTLQSSLSVTSNTTLANTLSTLRSTYSAKGAYVTGRLYDNTLTTATTAGDA